jgi:uncharacterized protein (TIGR03083 family)
VVNLDAAYADTKAKLLVDVLGAGDSAWEQTVPATPDWSVLDVVAHVTGIASDSVAGRVPAGLNLLEQFRDPAVVAVRDRFADGQVERRRGATPAEVLAEWDEVEIALLARLDPDTPPEKRLPLGYDAIVVTDLCVHADDVAGALGVPPHRGSPAAGVALAAYCFGVDYRIRALGLPALSLRYGERERILGDGDPGATVAADRWELLRVLAGRRSRSQIEALDWTGDPAPYLPLLPAYGERAQSLQEA